MSQDKKRIKRLIMEQAERMCAAIDADRDSFLKLTVMMDFGVRKNIVDSVNGPVRACVPNNGAMYTLIVSTLPNDVVGYAIRDLSKQLDG